MEDMQDVRAPYFRYGLLAAPIATALLFFQVYLPTWLISNSLMGYAEIGMVFLFARLLDTVTDPIIGTMSDKAHAKGIHRKTWVWLSFPLLMGVSVLLMQGGWTVLPALVLICLWYILGTAVVVPYYAWGAELVRDLQGNNKIAGARAAFGLIATVLALSTPAIIWPGAGVDRTTGFTLIFTGALILIAFIGLRGLKEQPRETVKQAVSISDGFREAARNGPLRRLLISQLLNGIANALPATLFLLFADHILKSPGAAGPLLMLYFVTAAIAIPVWSKLSLRFGNIRIWRVAMIVAAAVFSFTLFVPITGLWLFVLITAVTGLMAGADLTLPAAVLSDISDQPEVKAPAGALFALWGVTGKLTLALAIGIAFPILGLSSVALSGEVGGATNVPDQMSLIALYALVPATLKLVAVSLLKENTFQER